MATVRIEDAKGCWVLLVNISEEPPAYGHITTTKDQGIIIEFTVADHPTCAHFKWAYPRGTELELRPELRHQRAS